MNMKTQAIFGNQGVYHKQNIEIRNLSQIMCNYNFSGQEVGIDCNPFKNISKITKKYPRI